MGIVAIRNPADGMTEDFDRRLRKVLVGTPCDHCQGKSARNLPIAASSTCMFLEILIAQSRYRGLPTKSW